MYLKDKIGIHLDQIKQIKGIENAVLTQRDGNPIQSTGVWFSKDEIFNVSSAASAIFNVGIHLHPDNLKYVLIEGKKAKILIAPLNSPSHHSLNKILEQQGILDSKYEFFIAITAQPNTNLGGIFLQTTECLKKIKTILRTSGESFKPPLIQFHEKLIQKIIAGFNVKENKNINFQNKISSSSLSLSENISLELKEILNNFSLAITDLIYASITIDGGFIASKIIKKWQKSEVDLTYISTMSDTLFRIADRYAWLLKKMNVESILLDCDNIFQLIYNTGNAIISIEIGKTRQKLGLIRRILPQFSNKVRVLIEEAQHNPIVFDFNGLLNELKIN